jgi:tricorn protease
MAYEEGGHIWILDPGQEPRPVPLYVAADEKTSLVQKEEITSGASDLDLSPDASRAAFVVHGEIFVVDVEDGGDARRLTHSHARDRWPKWMPDGETLVFVSDRREQQDMWSTSAPELDVEEWAEEDEVSIADHPAVPPAESLTDTPTDEREPLISPDGEWIAFQTPNDDLWIIPAKGGEPRLLVRGPQIYIPAWSPDSRWIAYEQHDASNMGDIFVIPAEGGEPINLTQHPAHDQVPFWSPDGFMLGFESDRSDDWDLWYLELVTEDEARILKREWKKEHASEGEDDEDEEEPEPLPIPIETDRDYTAHRITTTSGFDDFAAWCPDTTWIAYRGTYQGERALLAVKADGTGLKKLSDAAPSELPKWDPDGGKLVYVSNGSIKTAELEGSDGSVDFTAEMVVDRPAEFIQMYNEAWRQLKNNFYDETMHGVDWDAVKAKYLPLAEAARTQDELHLAISEVLGELRASHLGIWPGGGGGPGSAYLGFDMELREQGGRRGWMVTDIMPKAPAERFPEKLHVGDFLLSIDGVALDASSNVDSLLLGKADEDIRLVFGDSPDATTGRPVLLTAEGRGDYMDHFYDRWVEENRDMVDALSDERIGYLHIRSMNQESLERFRREIRAEAPEREALIIDVRFNGGGNIHQELIEILDSRPIVRYKPRDGIWRTQPATAFFGPKTVLINEYSFSDAELFPQAFRELGLGPLIGVPTGGGVIGTGGTRLLDGSWLRLPSTGWESLDHQNLENYGVPPDIEVDMTPADWVEGKDPQIEAAVEYLLSQLRDRTSTD